MSIVSIVIVNWNGEDVLGDCLDSLWRGRPVCTHEVILIDNASTDGSADGLEERYPGIRVVRNTENRGFAAANNQGFELATREHVLLLNSDTIIRGDVVEASAQYLQENPGVGAMGCRVLNTDGTVQRTCSREPTLLNLAIMLLMLDKLPWPPFFGRYQYRHWDRADERDVQVISGCYLMLPRAVMSEVGMLDEAFFFFGEETDWCRRIRRAGFRTVLAPVGEIVHHGGGSARKLSHKRDVMLTQALVRFHRKHGGNVPAAAAWTLLAAFNVSRWLGYAALGLASRSARARAAHFRGVARGMGRAWPKGQARVRRGVAWTA